MTDTYFPEPIPAPESVVDVPAAPEFFVVSQRKLLIMYIGTLGLYGFYWFYRNWRGYRDSTRAAVWPLPRSVFNIFFVHSLFRLIRKSSEHETGIERWRSRREATLFVILTIGSSLIDRAVQKSYGSPWTDCLSLLLVIPMAMFLSHAQIWINRMRHDPEGNANHAFTKVNFCWLAFGALIWLSSLYDIIGILFPATSGSGTVVI